MPFLDWIPVPKVTVQFSCTECGTTSGRWLGKCPGCGAFGTLVEELHGSDSVPAPVRREARSAGGRARGGVGEDLDRSLRARPRARRRARARFPRSRRRGTWRREVHSAADGARRDRALRQAGAARDGRGVGLAGVAARREAGWGGFGRDPRRDRPRRRVRDARERASRRLRHRLRADAATRVRSARLRVRDAGARGGRPPASSREGGGRRDRARRARDEGRRRRRARASSSTSSTASCSSRATATTSTASSVRRRIASARRTSSASSR